jgi:hypothetical protein
MNKKMLGNWQIHQAELELQRHLCRINIKIKNRYTCTNTRKFTSDYLNKIKTPKNTETINALLKVLILQKMTNTGYLLCTVAQESGLEVGNIAVYTE